MAIEIVSFPIKNGGSFHSYVNVYQRLFVDWIYGAPYMAAPHHGSVMGLQVIPNDLDDNWGTTWLPVTLWLFVIVNIGKMGGI